MRTKSPDLCVCVCVCTSSSLSSLSLALSRLSQALSLSLSDDDDDDDEFGIGGGLGVFGRATRGRKRRTREKRERERVYIATVFVQEERVVVNVVLNRVKGIVLTYIRERRINSVCVTKGEFFGMVPGTVFCRTPWTLGTIKFSYRLRACS